MKTGQQNNIRQKQGANNMSGILKRLSSSIMYGNTVTLVLRIFIGLLFIYSGFFKILNLENFGNIIIQYDIAPLILVPYAAVIMPFLEFILGILLLSGYRVKSASFISIVLMLFFIVIISINVVRGNVFDCGCFELDQFGIKEEIGIPLLVRDFIFSAILLILFYAKRHPFSIDSYIEKRDLENI